MAHVLKLKHGKITVDLDQLEKAKKELSKKYVTRVGILAGAANRDDSGQMTNAMIGAVHEFGVKSKNIPQRSFLRHPLHFKRLELTKKMSIIERVFRGMLVRDAYKVLGNEAINIIDQAFRSRGFGQWPQSKRATVRAKLNKLSGRKRKKIEAMSFEQQAEQFTPLIDTGQLRRAVDYEVREKA